MASVKREMFRKASRTSRMLSGLGLGVGGAAGAGAAGYDTGTGSTRMSRFFGFGSSPGGGGAARAGVRSLRGSITPSIGVSPALGSGPGIGGSGSGILVDRTAMFQGGSVPYSPFSANSPTEVGGGADRGGSGVLSGFLTTPARSVGAAFGSMGSMGTHQQQGQQRVVVKMPMSGP